MHTTSTPPRARDGRATRAQPARPLPERDRRPALRRQRDGLLHVINIRDWHTPDDSYDAERRAFGRHCLAGSWGARYVDGLEQYLDPVPPRSDGKASFCERGNARIYHIHADSVFDFRPRWDERPKGQPQPKFHPSELERLLDVLVTGSAADIEQLAIVLKGSEGERRQSQVLNRLAIEAAGQERGGGLDADLRRGDRRLHRHQGAAHPQRPALALRAPEPRRVGHAHRQPKSRAPPARARLRGQAPERRGDPRHRRPRELPRVAAAAPGRERDRLRRELLRSTAPSSSTSRTCSPTRARSSQEYAHLTGKRAIAVYDTIKRANTSCSLWGSAFLIADARRHDPPCRLARIAGRGR